MTLLNFGQKVQINHPALKNETGWITNVKPSYIRGHNWQYLIRTDQRLKNGKFLWGGEWFDEKYIKSIAPEKLPAFFNLEIPKEWPPKMTQTIGRRPGIWGINGSGVNQEMIDKMLSWNPGAITCFYDYIQANGIEQYHQKYSNVPIIIRFQHDKNWQENPTENAKNKSVEIVSKWPTIEHLNPYVYFCNEMNLHYENGDNDIGNQYLYETPEFYQKYADWVTELADRIKQQVPDMRLVCPPFAYGHKEDGEPENGIPKLGWSGYEYLTDTIKTHFNNIICGHYYWGSSQGSNEDWLTGEDAQWHAFRWQKVLELFKVSYGMDVKIIIDEAGNFSTVDDDFTQQIAYYADKVLTDERVIALTYFLWHDPTNSPGNTLNDWQKIKYLDNHISVLKDWVLIADIPEPEPPEEIPDKPEEETNLYQINVRYAKMGLPLVVGTYPVNNILVTVQPPYGSSYIVTTNTKPEWGEGGFEAGYANMSGIYSLTIEGVKYEVECKDDGNSIVINFDETGETPEQVILKSSLIDKEKALEIMNQYPDIFEVVND